MMLSFYRQIVTHEVKKMNEIPSDNWISIEEAAEYLGVKPVTVRNWIRKKNGIPAQKIGKLWKFKRSELDEWIKSGKSAIK
jgi:excisionase family DNA binding protein